jgi:hypothetical protein
VKFLAWQIEIANMRVSEVFSAEKHQAMIETINSLDRLKPLQAKDVCFCFDQLLFFPVLAGCAYLCIGYAHFLN